MQQNLSSLSTTWAALPSNVRGVLWAICSAVCLSIMLTLIKLLGQSLHVAQILAIRQAVILLVVLPSIVAAFPGNLSSSRVGLHFVRIFFSIAAMLSGYTAIVHLPMADFTALSFARAFFVTILAILYLREAVDGRRWSATIVGFVGVLFVMRPVGSNVDFYALLAVFAAASMAAVSVIIRELTRTEPPITILTYQAIFIGLLAAPFAVMFWVPMSLTDWLMAIGVGVAGAAGQLTSIRAFRDGEASVVAPIDYTKLIWATVIGWAVFSSFPDAYTLLGAALIVLASLYIFAHQLHRKQQEP